jgi:hypothetical protein
MQRGLVHLFSLWQDAGKDTDGIGAWGAAVARDTGAGRLTDAELDAQLDGIGKEEAALEAQIAELGGRIASADSIAGNISSAQALLANLRKRLDELVSWEQERRLIEVLVGGVRVDTIEECGVTRNPITVTYRFKPARPTDASRRKYPIYAFQQCFECGQPPHAGAV